MRSQAPKKEYECISKNQVLSIIKTVSRSHISQNISNIKATDLIGTLVEEHLEIGPVSQTIIAVILVISISIRIGT